MRISPGSGISSDQLQVGFHQIVQVSPERFRQYLEEQVLVSDNCDLSFTGKLPIFALNLFGSMAVFAVEVHPCNSKIIGAQHYEFNVGASKEEISSSISQLNRDRTFIYLIGGGERIRETRLPWNICKVFDEYISAPGAKTLARINNIRHLEYPLRRGRDYDFISAYLGTDGILRYCLHDLEFNAPN